ncbi:hypothetical protein CAI21_17425 [Alkalilimnicola ehrlichii]|uniref:Uncharacterized protein n=1 Tax=Alkalilimnicola ehrlichii TaxID=351052 RepID=A0A3E0WMS1_9GAMM|nr:hypothetical protein CAI21_17425 [Alkalilimnicola ehrlichii]RFA33245.1 hypothetical protein CAL65_17910 [Alkalilimnicola ehrlichii]
MGLATHHKSSKPCVLGMAPDLSGESSDIRYSQSRRLAKGQGQTCEGVSGGCPTPDCGCRTGAGYEVWRLGAFQSTGARNTLMRTCKGTGGGPYAPRE